MNTEITVDFINSDGLCDAMTAESVVNLYSLGKCSLMKQTIPVNLPKRSRSSCVLQLAAV